MTTQDIIFFLMTAFVGFLIGLAKGGLGGLIGTLATPLMSLVMPPNQVVGLLLPLLMFADVFAVASYWKRWKGRLVLLLLPGGILGVTVATFLITRAPTRELRIILAVIVFIFTLYKVFEKPITSRLTYAARDWHGLLAGTIAGFSSGLAHAGGPPIGIYLLLQRLNPLEFNATSVLFFAVLNWIKVPYYFYADLFDFQRVLQVLFLLPVIPLGVLVGRWMASRINRQAFERLIVVLLFLAAIMLVIE